MAYRFKHGDSSVQDALRRIALDQIDKAIEETNERALSIHEKVHQARKRCKKLRGLLRLVRPAFDDYRAENACFRDAARALSFVRDAEVLIGTYDGVVDAYRDQIERAAFGAIRRRLTLRRKAIAERQREVKRRLAHVGEIMREARRRARDWRLSDSGFDALAGGLGKTYKRAAKAIAAAQSDPTPEAFHEWRKRIKYHGYHARLLSPIWREPLKAHREAAERLSDLLGAHHDLTVFQQALAEPDAFHKPAEIAVMIGLARRRQAALASDAFPLGTRLLAEPTAHLAARWQAYWDIWRQEGASSETALAA